MRIVVLVALSVWAVAGPAAAAEWGSIFVSPSGYYGTGRGPSAPDAEKAAKFACNRQQHGFCQGAITFQTCGALAVARDVLGPQRGAYGAEAPTAIAARRAALGQCEDTAKAQKRFLSGCKAAASFCVKP